MKQIVRCVLLACVLALTIRPNAHAGTYFLVERDVHYNDPTQQGNYGPYIIVHPPGYTGAPGVLTVNICVEPGSETLIPAIQWAIDTWNARKARYGNCRSCLTWEQKAQAPTGPVVLNTVTLHELGHCALGLGHSNEQE